MPTIGEKAEKKKQPKILAYGQSMVGKTRFLISIRKVYNGPCYIMNFDPEENLMPLMADPTMRDVQYDQYDHDKGYDNMVKKIVDLKRSCPYDVIVIENLNIMYKTFMEHNLRIASRTDSDGARQQDWGLTNKRVESRLKEVIDLPCLVYATTHQILEKDELSGRTTGRILIPSKQCPESIPPMFNLQLRFYTIQKVGAKPEYWVQCAGDGTWGAGDKTGTLDFREEPDFVKMALKMGKRFLDPPKPVVAGAGVETTPPTPK